eukprot:c21706_g1_i1.p1 GENE.c21706_g1_i1~~c21706_g1_i1.p1  ORF type:complete len:443 (-),score=136.65 c21706_g1_i1:93-1421(-)
MNLIRKTVSNDRRRYQKENYDLDLTYITSQILAMGFPASGVEGVFRNHIDDVSKFLNETHPHHYMIFNLAGRKYEESKFEYNVLDCGWPDHHSPPLPLLFELCHAMQAWLGVDPENVVVVHCVAGKGRTGTLICAYLLWSGFAVNCQEALTYFAEKRSEKLIGVEYPSQQRVLNYFERALKTSRSCPTGKQYEISKIIIHGIPQFDKETGGCSPFIHILTAPRIQDDFEIFETIYRSDWRDVPKFNDQEHACLVIDRLCKDDVLFRFYHSPTPTQPFATSGKLMFRFALNTNFEKVGVVRLGRDDIDLVHLDKTTKIFPENFHIDVILSEPNPNRDYSIPVESKDYEKEGWLWKQGQVFSAYKKRWFILKDNTLSYYKSYHDTIPAGCIFLENSRIEVTQRTDRPFCFSILTIDREYNLSVDDGASLDNWVKLLTRCANSNK